MKSAPIHLQESNLKILQGWLFAQLRAELWRDHPEVCEAVISAPPEDEAALRRWAESLAFPPLQPWNNLIVWTFSVRLSLSEIEFIFDYTRDTQSGRALRFFRDVAPVVMESCLERLDHLVKMMGRGRNAVLPNPALKEIGSRLASLKTENLDLLRNFSAHGPHAGRQDRQWITDGVPRRVWELVAIGGGDDTDAINAFHADDVEQIEAIRQSVLNSLKTFAESVNREAGGILTALPAELNGVTLAREG